MNMKTNEACKITEITFQKFVYYGGEYNSTYFLQGLCFSFTEPF